jgi:hypothetical protein
MWRQLDHFSQLYQTVDAGDHREGRPSTMRFVHELLHTESPSLLEKFFGGIPELYEHALAIVRE